MMLKEKARARQNMEAGNGQTEPAGFPCNRSRRANKGLVSLGMCCQERQRNFQKKHCSTSYKAPSGNVITADAVFLAGGPEPATQQAACFSVIQTTSPRAADPQGKHGRATWTYGLESNWKWHWEHRV